MKRVLLLSSSLLAFVAADYACTRSNAIEWPATGNIFDVPDATPGSCVSNCNGDAGCLALCETGQCNSVGCGDDDGLIIDDGVDGDDGGLIKKRSLYKRQSSSFSCADTEACYLYTDGDLLCVNMDSGDYTDSSGGNGNAITGAYTASSGDTQTVAAGATGTGLTGSTTASTRTTASTNTASTSPTQSVTLASTAAVTAATNGAVSSAGTVFGVVGSGFGILINLLL